MATINEDALNGLMVTVASLLAPVEPGLERSLLFNSARVTPTGIGGFVGLHHDPVGDIMGRRVEAKLCVNLRANGGPQLESAVADLTRALLTPDRATLQAQGILKLALDELGPMRTTGAQAERDVHVAVLYEFLQLPQQAGDTIREIPLNLNHTIPAAATSQNVLLDAVFQTDPLEWFEVVDDPQANRNRPSQWTYNPAEARIEQRSNIWGGSPRTDNPNKAGTYLVLLPQRALAADFDLTVQLSSGDDDQIGLVFRWQDVDNFYFFVMDRSNGYRLMGKKIGGVFAFLDTPALNEAEGFDIDQLYRVRIHAEGPVLRAFLDEQLVLEGQDTAFVAPGRVGFMCRTNDQAYFYSLKLQRV